MLSADKSSVLACDSSESLSVNTKFPWAQRSAVLLALHKIGRNATYLDLQKVLGVADIYLSSHIIKKKFLRFLYYGASFIHG